MVAKHSSYIASVGDTSVMRNSLPFYFINYVKLGGFVSSIELMNANERKPFFPLSGDNALYKRWCQLLVLPREALAILVAIPRGANGTAQLMTATVHMLGSAAARVAGRIAGDPTRSVGLRWIHCQ